MRPLRMFRTTAYIALAAGITAVAYLAVPVIGMASDGPKHPEYSFEEFGNDGDRFADVQISVLPERPDGDKGEQAAAANKPAAETPDIDLVVRGPGVYKRPHSSSGPERVAAADARGLTRPGQKKVQPGKKKGKKGKCVDPAEEIQRTGIDTFAVEREFVESYTGNMERLNTLAAVGRHKNRAGQADGFVIGNIRCGSPLHQGGIRNGDVVHEVNGRKVNNLFQALTTYSAVKKQDTITIRLTRRDGEEHTVNYQLY